MSTAIMATIVVGVDGSPASHSALRVAIDEATLRGSRIMIVSCWSPEARHLTHRTTAREDDTFDKAQTIAARAIAAVEATALERSHIVTITAEGQPGHELVHASRHGQLLVIGSTTRHAMARRAGKTVVDYCLRFSDVPVLVVPYTPTDLRQRDVDAELRGARTGEGVDLPVRYDPFTPSVDAPQAS